MSARNLSAQLFHGTTATLKPGDTIKPKIDSSGRLREVAFATSNMDYAVKHAQSRVTSEGVHHGNVYELEPNPAAGQASHSRYYSRTGFTVKGQVASVLGKRSKT